MFRRGAREERAQHAQQAEAQAAAKDAYSRSILQWQYVVGIYTAGIEFLRAQDSVFTTLQTRGSERTLAEFRYAQLIQPRSSSAVLYGGATYRVTDRLSVRGGAATSVSSAERPKAVASGTAIVTTTRVVFGGDTRTLEWDLGKLLSWQAFDDWIALPVSNRQRVSGIQVGISQFGRLQAAMHAATALRAGRGDELLGDFEALLRDQLGEVPQPPDDVAPDSRLAELVQTAHLLLNQSTTETATALAPVDTPEKARPATAWPEVGFATLSISNVVAGLRLSGWTPKSLRIEATDDSRQVNEQIRAATQADSAVAVVVTGDLARRHGMLDGTTPALVVVCAEAVELAAENVQPWDLLLPQSPQVLMNPPESHLNALVQERKLGKASLTIGTAIADEAQQALVVAAVKPGLQGNGLLILHGDEQAARQLASEARGWAAIAINPRVGE